MTAYYNENDPFAAAWLRNLIAEGLIAPGDVDERDIRDVLPEELDGYTQHHFFAGIGGWSLALRRAGWPDDRPVWTGSCPCQSLSTAGRGAGFADERHLWPHWFHLIGIHRPDVIFGEQVSSPLGLAWWDLVSADLEDADYAAGALDTCAAGVGAPHIRQRLYWVAYTEDNRREGRLRSTHGWTSEQPSGHHTTSRLEHTNGRGQQPRREGSSPVGQRHSDEPARRAERLADTSSERHGSDDVEPESRRREPAAGQGDGTPAPGPEGAGPTNGFWRAADWLLCRDGKWRPVEPGSFPLADGVSNRVGSLRGYGNAINVEQAATFVSSYLDTRAELAA